MIDKSAMRSAALSLVMRGWRVLPLTPRAKVPATTHGFHDATMDADVITRLWAAMPEANVGVAAEASGLLIIDVDPRHGGHETMAELARELGGLPMTVECATGGPDCGRHLYFRAPADGAHVVGSLGAGIDIRYHGYVVAPPSRHPSGGTYRWTNDPDSVEVADLPPAWLARLIRAERPRQVVTPICNVEGSAYGRAAVDRELSDVRGTAEGDRNRRTNLAAFSLGQLHAGGEIPDVRVDIVGAAMDAGLPVGEARATVESGWRAGLAQPRTAPTPITPIRSCASTAAAPTPMMEASADPLAPITDTTLAQRLASLVRDSARYVADLGQWWRYDGTRWIPDVGGVWMLAMTAEVSRQLAREATDCRDPKLYPILLGAAAKAQACQRREHMISLAKAEPGMVITADQFDTDPWLLNTPNGTIDLRTCLCRAHSPTDHITQMAGAPYDPDAQCPRWDRFLGEVLPDAETVEYVRRWAGYVLTAVQAAHVVPYLLGRGANGKSVLLETLRAVWGDYAVVGDTSILVERNGDMHTCGIAAMERRRLVIFGETPAGRPFAEAQLKSLSGGDTITARGMRENPRQIRATWHLVLAGNHRLVVRGQDEGVWRRLCEIPFDRVIPENRRDPNLTRTLRDEMPGILAWAVRGCLAWQREGLGTSARIQDATAAYREDSDRLAPFLDDACVMDPNAVTTRSDLYAAYTEWCMRSHVRPVSEREVVELIRGRAIEECRARQNGKRPRAWAGIRLTGSTGSTFPPDLGVSGLEEISREVIPQTGRNVDPRGSLDATNAGI